MLLHNRNNAINDIYLVDDDCVPSRDGDLDLERERLFETANLSDSTAE